jgi:tRNA threonylcarbamoyladenosine biosynthesis protein TsaB
MSLILCMDTATSVCSVALAKNSKVLSVRESTEEKAHASYLGVFIEQVLHDAAMNINQLDAVAVSKGPGSYTGLRIGVSTAKGICYGADIPLISVETLQIMAYGMCREVVNEFAHDFFADSALYCPMIDARRMEVYTALFDFKNKKVKATEAIVVQEHSFDSFLQESQIVFAGNGVEKCKSLLSSKNALYMDNFKHSALYMTDIVQKAYHDGKFEDLAYFEPYYLKEFIATSPKRKVM